jgi:hypothetical protein
MPPHAGDAACVSAPVALRPAPPSVAVCAPAEPSDAADAANRFLSHEALAREPHSLRALAPLLQVRACAARRMRANARSF